METYIKELRVSIDGLAQLTKELKPYKDYFNSHGFPVEPNSKEIEKAVDSLLLAKAWLGKLLQELGSSTPYQNDGNRHSVADIEPTADINLLNKDKYWIPDLNREPNHIEKVDWLRQEIKKLVNFKFKMDIEDLSEFSMTVQFLNIQRYSDKVKDYLAEARFWLGFELSRCKESK